jgi:hypothetical protein
MFYLNIIIIRNIEVRLSWIHFFSFDSWLSSSFKHSLDPKILFRVHSLPINIDYYIKTMIHPKIIHITKESWIFWALVLETAREEVTYIRLSTLSSLVCFSNKLLFLDLLLLDLLLFARPPRTVSRKLTILPTHYRYFNYYFIYFNRSFYVVYTTIYIYIYNLVFLWKHRTRQLLKAVSSKPWVLILIYVNKNRGFCNI